MKTARIFFLALVLTTATTNVQAQQQPSRNHGPLCNGTLNDPTIIPTAAVPMGSLKGLKRNLTDQEILGDPNRPDRIEMMSGDDMQSGRAHKTISRRPVRIANTRHTDPATQTKVPVAPRPGL